MDLTSQGEMIEKAGLSLATCPSHRIQRRLVDSTPPGRAAFGELVCRGGAWWSQGLGFQARWFPASSGVSDREVSLGQCESFQKHVCLKEGGGTGVKVDPGVRIHLIRLQVSLRPKSDRELGSE